MSDRLFERAVHDWLKEGSDRTPPAAVDAVLFAVKTTPQQRDLRIPRRFTLMPPSLKLATALAIAAIVGVGVLAYLGRGPGFGSSPTPAATPTTAATGAPTSGASPSPDPLDVSQWIQYRSGRYAYTASYPSGWDLHLASGDAAISTLLPLPDERVDQLVAPCSPSCRPGPNVIGVTSFAAASEDEFIAQFLSAADEELCVPPRYQWEPISVRGIDGSAWPGCAANGSAPAFTAFVFANRRAYLFTAYAPIGGNLFQETRELMGKFLTTVALVE